MTHIAGYDRSQLFLLPEVIDDYIAADNPVRFIDAFVDGLDLRAAGFERVEAKATGRPGYAPGDLLKIYIYGYLNRIQSSRRLERETQRNIEPMWLTGRLTPDFKTIADFRRDNGQAICAICTQFVALCRQFKMFARALVAIDGSKFKAVNNRDKNFTVVKVAKRIEQTEASLARYFAALDRADRQDDDVAEARTVRLKEKIAGLQRQMQSLKDMQKQVEAAPDKQISLTDPDARSMATSGKGTGVVGYNVQIAVDAEHHLIVAHEVTNVGSDRAQLTSMGGKARDATGCKEVTVLADRGYYDQFVPLDQSGAGAAVGSTLEADWGSNAAPIHRSENEPGAYPPKRLLDGGLPPILHDGVNRRRLTEKRFVSILTGATFRSFSTISAVSRHLIQPLLQP